jgi:hypothetical protein
MAHKVDREEAKENEDLYDTDDSFGSTQGPLVVASLASTQGPPREERERRMVIASS